MWTPHYAAVRGIGTITLPALPVDATGRATAADIVALFAGEGLRATVAPVNGGRHRTLPRHDHRLWPHPGREGCRPMTPDDHQREVARRTLRMPDALLGVMGGPSKAEAARILEANRDAYGPAGEHDHAYGPVTAARLTGNPHRRCTVAGCRWVTLDLDDDD